MNKYASIHILGMSSEEIKQFLNKDTSIKPVVDSGLKKELKEVFQGIFGKEEYKSLIKDFIDDNISHSYALLLVDTPKGCSIFSRSFDYENIEETAITLLSDLKSAYVTIGIDGDFDFIQIHMFVGLELISEIILGKKIKSYGYKRPILNTAEIERKLKIQKETIKHICQNKDFKIVLDELSKLTILPLNKEASWAQNQVEVITINREFDV